MSRELDAIDKRILNELQTNGRLSIVEQADRVHLTKTPCTDRVRRLERAGILAGYHAVVDPGMVGLGHLTIVHVHLSKTGEGALRKFNREVVKIPEIQTCMMIAGSFDYMLKVRTRDIAQFRDLLGDKISNLPGVMQTHSFAVMECVKEDDYIKMPSD